MDIGNEPSSSWDVPRPAARLWLSFGLGLLGAILFPVKSNYLPQPFGAFHGTAAFAWISTALAGAILLLVTGPALTRYESQRATHTFAWLDVSLRAAAVALLAPLLLFAARPIHGEAERPRVSILTRLAFALFPFVMAAGCPVTIFWRHDPYPLQRFALTFWTWLGCALLFLFSPWPRQPRAPRRHHSRDHVTALLILIALLALALMFILSFLSFLQIPFSPRSNKALMALLTAASASGILFLLWLDDALIPQLGALPRARSIGPFGAMLLMAMFLFPLGLYAYRPLLGLLEAAIKGDLFTGGVETGSYLGGWLGQKIFCFTYFTALTIPYVVIVRWLTDRHSLLGYWAFTDNCLAVCVLLLSTPFSIFCFVIRYIASMGFTPARICGLLYTSGGCIVVLAFFTWAVWPPKREA